jgi:hypothetical protein
MVIISYKYGTCSHYYSTFPSLQQKIVSAALTHTSSPHLSHIHRARRNKVENLYMFLLILIYSFAIVPECIIRLVRYGE